MGRRQPRAWAASLRARSVLAGLITALIAFVVATPLLALLLGLALLEAAGFAGLIALLAFAVCAAFPAPRR